MAHPHLKAPLAEFTAVVHRTKNRLIAIPAEVQGELGLERRADNHIVLASLRPRDAGHWNHHYFKLTYDNEFAIPNDVERFRPGQQVQVRIHRVIPDRAAPTPGVGAGAQLLIDLADRPAVGWRSDGSERLDDYLRDEIG